MMKKIALYNPCAGNGISEEKLTGIISDCELVDMTKISSYSDFFADKASDDTVIICGGDGTLNRFANDTRALDIPCELMYLALGTGNDFLKDIGEDASALVPIKKYLENLPTVLVNGKEYLFINNVGFGIDGYCCEVGDALKAQGETDINYSSIAIKGLLFHFKPKNAIVTVDGVRHEYKKVWIAPTMNGRFYGGGMMPTPSQERLDSNGTLSVMIWHDSGKLRTLTAFPSLFKGEHLKHEKMIEVLTGHEITVEFDEPCALQIDGETILGVTSYTASKQPCMQNA
ncbi:MAG: diacylglycerol kinase family protein [Clostridia bacterium]|nr:diacylglycerol kinase family protein [Clostridia bacterium]